MGEPRSRPRLCCLSPNFALPSTGQEKEQYRSRWSCRGNQGIFPEHEATYGPPQHELNEVPGEVASFLALLPCCSETLGKLLSAPGLYFRLLSCLRHGSAEQRWFSHCTSSSPGEPWFCIGLWGGPATPIAAMLSLFISGQSHTAEVVEFYDKKN